MAGSVKIVQISDLHLYANTNKELLGVNTEQSFKAIIELLHHDSYQPDIILLSGDLTQDGNTAAYQRLASLLFTFKKPIYFTAGNHDCDKTLATVYPLDNIHADKQILLPGWQIILLDSHKPGAVEGLLTDKELQYLKTSLEQHPHRHALIVFHHQPLPVGSAWLDNLGIKNAEDFWKTVEDYPQVKMILFGHVHQEFATEHKGVHCYAAPSTCIQFKPKQDDFALDHRPPGYRWLTLHEDGTWDTGVKRNAVYIGTFDTNAKGY